MKFFVKNLILFVVLVIVFSSLESCDETSGLASNTPSSNTTAVASNSNSGTADDSTYPPLQSSIADADMELLNGTTGKLSARKGNVVLVNFWAVWCGPCREEMPKLVELQDKYRDKGLQVIGLNVGKDETGDPESFDVIKAFGEKNHLNYELARSPNSLTSQVYSLANFEAIPISLLISRNGKLRAVLRGGGPEPTNQMIQSVERAMGE